MGFWSQVWVKILSVSWILTVWLLFWQTTTFHFLHLQSGELRVTILHWVWGLRELTHGNHLAQHLTHRKFSKYKLLLMLSLFLLLLQEQCSRQLWFLLLYLLLSSFPFTDIDLCICVKAISVFNEGVICSFYLNVVSLGMRRTCEAMVSISLPCAYRKIYSQHKGSIKPDILFAY